MLTELRKIHDIMLEKVRGIVLHSIRYGDSGAVVRLYTDKFGRQSFMVKGIRNRKAGRHAVLFQPLFILDVEMNHKPLRELQIIKEFTVAFAPFGIQSDIRKSSIAMFIGEVLNNVIREETPHEELFDYIESSIIYLENSSEGISNFHISFLTGLSSFLGFEPSQRKDSSYRFFDLKNGIFSADRPAHGSFASPEASDKLALFMASSFDEAGKIPMNGQLRLDVLETLVSYYSLHLPGVVRIKSLDVLKAVFG